MLCWQKSKNFPHEMLYTLFSKYHFPSIVHGKYDEWTNLLFSTLSGREWLIK